MKKILGLDLGTNSIGWALIEQDFSNKKGRILGLGSRIIPMSQDILDTFGKGQSHSQTADRTGYRGVRRLYQRDNLRRERLHRVLNVLGFLPKHYADSIDFEKKLGQFKEGLEPKLNYKKNGKGNQEFIFQESFNEMVREFEAAGQNIKIPYDWTLYYLRKKALAKPISKQELAWIILNFNQKRGYYQLRGDEEELSELKNEEFYSLKVVDVKPTEDKNAKGTWYNVVLENGWVYRRQSKESLAKMIGMEKEFIVTTQFEKDGSLKRDKEGIVKRSFRAVDSEKDWTAIKKKTEQDIDASEKYIGQYIFNSLLANPNQKIRGKLIKTIERKYYKKELKAILKQQSKYHPEFSNQELYKACIEELYPRNEIHQAFLKDKDLLHLFVEDIIFYQRPLKSKKSTIANCQYETRKYFVDGEIHEKSLKGAPKSNPYFQEFRLWQFIRNVKIYQKEKRVDEKIKVDYDVTNEILKTESDWTDLFLWLNDRKEVDQKAMFQYLVTQKYIEKRDKENYKWNYVDDKKYPCNDTRAQFLSRLSKVNGVQFPSKFLDIVTRMGNENSILYQSREYQLWHIVYSVKDKKQFESALRSFANKYDLDEESFFENFQKFPAFKNEYGAYSEKALKKLLPLMRTGNIWSKEDIPNSTINRIDNIIERLKTIDFDKEKIEEVADDDIPKQLLKSFIPFKDRNPYAGLNTFQACYAVYNRHSEASIIEPWKTSDGIATYLKQFKQHSLRNPIVEQVVTETLRVVKDIWENYGELYGVPYTEIQNQNNGKIGKVFSRFFDEVHVELGREMKNPADNRARITNQISENENTNNRIRELLKEIMDDPKVEGDIRPNSSSQQEILKIFEEGVYLSNDEIDDEIERIRKNNSPSKNEITRYKLWLEQGYVSPYTGETIQLSRLFTEDYQIEHIIPQARLFDDSLSNKVICESAVNEEKGKSTAYEFIKARGGETIELGNGKNVTLFKFEDYEVHCNKYFKKNRAKLKKLLTEDIPDGFIERQINDTRYISKLVKGLLSNIVREEDEKEATSKHVISVTGSITDRLKNDWGLNDQWNKIIAPRFKRMNQLSNSNDFYFWDEKINDYRNDVPDDLKKGFNKKRIDHRHHAMDALVVAATQRQHIQYLNSLNNEKIKHELQPSLLIKNGHGHFTKHFLAPWNGFALEAKTQLEKTVVSFKQNLRVINKASNKSIQWVEKDGKLKKQPVPQTKGDNWAIRKPLHKETVSGKVLIKRNQFVTFFSALEKSHLIVDPRIRDIIDNVLSKCNNDIEEAKQYFRKNPCFINNRKIQKVELFVEATATRIALSDKFTRKQLQNISDSGIQTVLENHLKNYVDEKGVERFDLAFSVEGIEDLNKNIVLLNNGKPHQPIKKVRVFEVGNKFPVGHKGNRMRKYVEAAKGTNLYFAIYEGKNKKDETVRQYDTIPLNIVIERLKQGENPAPEKYYDKDGYEYSLLFTLSPNDLVYVPTDEELLGDDLNIVQLLQRNDRIYKMVNTTQNKLLCVPQSYASPIRKNEIGSNNVSQNTLDGKYQIKERCCKLKVDRLGNVKLWNEK
jgi:CRISPR-associated endonuclease Csn1